MSMHKIPLTPSEEAGLRAHGLDIGTPSQLSDVFRLGMAWAESQRIPVGSIHKAHLNHSSDQHWCKELLLYSPDNPGDSPERRVQLYTVSDSGS